MRTRRTKSSSNPVPSETHRSVLLHEAIEGLDIKIDDVVVDATLGGAGHAKEIANKLGEGGNFIGIDADSDAIERARIALKEAKPKVHLVQENFRNLLKILERLQVKKINSIIFDFGWSAYHLDAGRGFSFQKNEPLLMTYAKEVNEATLTAKKIVNEWEEESISDILWGWGEEKFSRQIAKEIVNYRKEKSIETTRTLSEIICKAVPAWYRHKKIHPATKTFQALRIAVNDEIGAITDGVNSALKSLLSGGRIAVITFHSTEDRVVKRIFRDWKEKGLGEVQKLIKPSKEEIQENPRARSSKLRIFKNN
jgi:16S rRNA (cytosine1402-N4)-methyltransferase